MPRISAEARATHTAAQSGKLKPSPGLAADERRAWKQIVDATPAGHLSERDRPLVENYIALTVAQRKLAKVAAGADAAALLDPKADASRALLQIASIGKTLAAIANRLKIAPLASHSAPHKAQQRAEQPTNPAPLLGGLARVK
ncbi:MAG: hypothetical protein V9G29_00725 [Burkholderiaceae bacterium]